MANQTSIYVDFATRDRLAALAERCGRSQIGQLRWMLDNNLEDLNGFEKAVLYQLGKDNGADGLVEAVSILVRDWQSLKGKDVRRSPSAGFTELLCQFSEAYRSGAIDADEARTVMEALRRMQKALNRPVPEAKVIVP